MITLHEDATISQQFFETDKQHQILKENIAAIQIVPEENEGCFVKIVISRQRQLVEKRCERIIITVGVPNNDQSFILLLIPAVHQEIIWLTRLRIEENL